LVKDEFVDDVEDDEYYFCNAPGCNVVYFSDGETFTKDQLKVPVGVKETTGARPLCYCFGHSIATIARELETKGRSDALDDIRRKMKNPGCRCETENPSGSCCLGSVSKGITIAESEREHPVSKSSANHAEFITRVGTVLSAIMASSCCWLPLLLILFGVSGAGVAGVLDSYRPVFVALTLVFLGAAFYFTYRPRQSGCPDDCCSVSINKDHRWFDLMTMNRAMLWIVTVLAIIFLFFPNYVGLILSGGKGGDVMTTSNPLIRTTVVAIEGMHCAGCATVAETSINKVPGVLQVQVDYAGKKAIIATESCCEFPQKAIFKAIKDSGYTGYIREDDHQ
jgi:copper chaperone CopZ